MNGPVSSRILIAENDPDTRGLLATWLERAGFECAPTSMAGALAEAERRRPDAALVSFDTPEGDPMQVAHRLVNWPDAAAVIVLSRPDLDIALQAARMGASDCLPWPTSSLGVVDTVRHAVARRRTLAAAQHVSALLREEIAHTRDEMKALVAGVDGRQAQALLLELLAERSCETYEHALRVARMATRLARVLRMPLDQIPDIRRAALLHDIGKVAVPARILNSRTRPTEDEVLALRLHVTIGEEVLATVPRLATTGVLVGATHEYYDGRGYPSRLRGGAIPLGSRIIAVADVYDAMTSIRPYRDPLTHDEANAELLRVAGSQLDPDVVRGWIGMTESRAC
jgi:putative two-component system response regulator